MKKLLKNIAKSAVQSTRRQNAFKQAKNQWREHQSQQSETHDPADSISGRMGGGKSVPNSARSTQEENFTTKTTTQNTQKSFKKDVEETSDGTVVTVEDNVNVSVREDTVFIDGQELEEARDKNITLIIQGDARNVEYHHDGTIIVEGSTKNVTTYYGTVNVKNDVNGFVQTKAGNVQVHGNVHGDVSSINGMVF